ncbi:MAG: ISNCY family transposase [Chloroflexota bacterium]
MSRKELPRPGIMKTLLAGRITNEQAGAALHVSVRQVQRLKRRFEASGAPALRHASRDRPSPRRLTDPVRAQIETLMQTVYEGFNDSHLTEKLCELHRLVVSRESVRRLRRALGRPPTRRRRAPKHRHRRPREDAVGALVQIDGSPFDWLEGRGPAMTLLGAIDDASSQVLALHFRPTEDLHGYATIFQQTFRAHGLPLALYGDGIGILVRNDAHWSPEEELAGAQHPTHLGRVLRELGIGYVQARSPQGKGRVERLWGTLQDRLVSELRLRGITTRAAANAFLPEFIADFNRRFARAPAVAAPVWRPAPRDLDRILSCRYTRIVARDNTVRLGARCVQIPRGPHGRSFARCRVEIRELLDGRLVVLYEGTVLTTTAAAPADFALHPRSAPSAGRPPSRPARAARSHALTNALTELAAAVAPPPTREHPWRRAYSPHLAARARRGEHRG